MEDPELVASDVKVGEKEQLGSETKNDSTVPLSKFLKERETVKSLKTELEKYQEQEKERAENDLIREKKYEELLAIREKELAELRNTASAEAEKMRIESLQAKAQILLNKSGMIDEEVGLKLIPLQELKQGSEQVEIEALIASMKKNKPYLFRTPRDSAENASTNSGSKVDARRKFETPAEAILRGFSSIKS